MADDAFEFNPPLGDVALPVIEEDAGEIILQLMQALVEAEDGDGLELFNAVGGNPEGGRPWQAIVIAELNGRRWLMRAATARTVAGVVARDRTLAWAFGDRGTFAGLFLKAAHLAEEMAAGRVPLNQGSSH